MIKLMVGLIFLTLVGCAGVPDKDNKGTAVIVDVEKLSKSTDIDKVTEISPDVMYLLLTAEIAGQRNKYSVALDGYLEAAKRVGDVRVAERAAKIGLFLKNTKKTTEAVSIWLKQDGNNLTARKIAALSALKEGDKTLAIEHLNKMLKDDPAGFEGALIELARILTKDNRQKASFILNVLDAVAEQHPDQATVLFVQALLAGQLNDAELAIAKVNKVLELQPDWDRALILRAQALVQNKVFDLAIDDLEKVLEHSPDNQKIRKMLGQVLMKTDALDDAVSVYKKVLESISDDGESQFAIALIYLQQKKEQEALVYLKKLVNKRGWDAQASFYIGRVEYKNERYEPALTWFDKVTQGPYEYDAAMAAVSVLSEQKNFIEAEKRIARLTEKFPKRKVNILLLQAEVFGAQKKYQQTFDLLSNALDVQPEHRDLLYGRALVAEKIDRLDILEEDLKKILLKNPNDAAVLNALGYTLVDRTNRYQEAAEYLKQALAIKPGEAVIMDSMGWLLFKQGKLADALALLQAAYDKQAENEIAAHLAEVLLKMGEKSDALEVIKKAIERAPEDEYLLKLLERFPELND